MPIGALGTVLTSDGDTAEWAAPAAGGWTQLATGTLSGSGVNLTSISQAYKDLRLVVEKAESTNGEGFALRLNNLSGSDYDMSFIELGTASVSNTVNAIYFALRSVLGTGSTNSTSRIIEIKNYSGDSKHMIHMEVNENNAARVYWGTHDETTTKAISELNILFTAADTFTGGTYTLYGAN